MPRPDDTPPEGHRRKVLLGKVPIGEPPPHRGNHVSLTPEQYAHILRELGRVSSLPEEVGKLRGEMESLRVDVMTGPAAWLRTTWGKVGLGGLLGSMLVVGGFVINASVQMSEATRSAAAAQEKISDVATAVTSATDATNHLAVSVGSLTASVQANKDANGDLRERMANLEAQAMRASREAHKANRAAQRAMER